MLCVGGGVRAIEPSFDFGWSQHHVDRTEGAGGDWPLRPEVTSVECMKTGPEVSMGAVGARWGERAPHVLGGARVAIEMVVEVAWGDRELD